MTAVAHPPNVVWKSIPGAPTITPLASFVHPEPALPRSVDGRRLDVFQAYQAKVRSHAARSPIQAYTVEMRNLELAYHPVHKTVAGRDGNGRLLTDLIRYAGGSAESFDEATPVIDLPGRSLLAIEGHAFNYYHFLLNALVRTAVVMQTHPRVAFDQIIVTDDSPGYVRAALEMLNVPAERVVSLARTPRVRCERALYGQYLSELVYPHRLAVQLLRGMFPASLCGGRRIYIVRENVRRVSNEAEVRDVLVRRGFEAVRCEKLSLAEQVRLFASADAVVAPHGAGLANITFCPRGTRVIELASPRFVETIFWYLATSCGHEYGILLGNGPDAPLSQKNGPGGWRSENAADMEIEAGKLERLCQEMGL
ncbi:MAG: glycosyltransferase 61 family protein [Tepidisphaeraceae bacterium]